MTPTFEQRIRHHRRRALIRAWEYRQRHDAHGVWYRLRRVLTSANSAHLIASDDLETLVAEGRTLEPVGGELEPPKRIVFVAAARIAHLEGARPIAVRLSADLLSAECLALTPFETGPDAPP